MKAFDGNVSPFDEKVKAFGEKEKAFYKNMSAFLSGATSVGWPLASLRELFFVVGAAAQTLERTRTTADKRVCRTICQWRELYLRGFLFSAYFRLRA